MGSSGVRARGRLSRAVRLWLAALVVAVGVVGCGGSPVTPRADQTATLLPDGGVLIAGGTANGTDALASAELFKP